MKPPVDDIVPRSFPKIAPEDGTGLYLASKLVEREVKKFPEWDLARDSIDMSLFTAQREKYLSEKRLADKRLKSIKKTESFNTQWAELQKKEEVLKDSFKKFHKFVRENQEKRERAEKRIQDEIALQAKRQHDTDHVREEIAYLTDIKLKMDRRIKEYRMFEDYLTKVVKSSQMFKNANDLLIRFEALVDSKHYLSDVQEQQLVALESAKTNMTKLIEEKALVLIGLNNKLADLQGRYDKANSYSLAMETMVSKIQDVSSQKLAEIACVRTSCYNIYKLMCKRAQIEPALSKDDFEQHLIFIKKAMTKLKRVYKTARILCIREEESMGAEPASKK